MFGGPERLDCDMPVCPIVAAARRNDKEDRLTAGQEIRPAMVDLSLLEASQRLRGSSRVRDLLEKWDQPRCEGDHALASPTDPVRAHSIANRQRRSPVYRNLLELSTGKKPQPLAIR